MLSNTWKHIAVALAVSLAFVLIKVTIIKHDQLDIMAVITFAVFCYGWELSQYQKHGQKRNYWSIRGLDTVTDWLAGVLTFGLIVLISPWIAIPIFLLTFIWSYEAIIKTLKSI